ncbi:MAG: nuclear transport factor 2 family protein [Planctomycetota bacterium]
MSANRAAAIAFVESYCKGDIETLADLLDESFRFNGPLHVCDNRESYIACLRNDPPISGELRVESITENADQVAVFYEYDCPGKVVMIAQLFTLRNGLIVETTVVFDGREVT